MSLNGGLIHQHLRDYKDSLDPTTRRWMTRRLAALAAVFVYNHKSCLGEWDSVFAVPSAQRCAPQAIVTQVKALAVSPQRTGTVASDGTMSIEDLPARDRVLVFDDTLTTGASLSAAVDTVRSADGTVVEPLVVSRHVTPGWPPTDDMLEWLTGRPWSETSCCRCGGEVRVPGGLPI